MTWVVPLALGGFAILLMATFTMLSARRRHRAAATPATVVGPRILVHDINDDRCTGCDACVAVCPTNVLDLVANKSRVLRFEDCIQCEACMFACPTEALVMFPEGAVPPPLNVPEIDEHFQTAVPGQYLIGEVAGKPLVKNAANLGRAVVEHMLQTGLKPSRGGTGIVDVAIVGSGPGGLAAALSCIHKGLSYVVLEKEQLIASTIARYPKGKLVMAEPYDTMNLSLLPVFDSTKEQLLPIWEELIERIGVKINRGESVESVTRSGALFEIRSTVASYQAKRVVLSIGTRGKPRTLQVPGENLPKVFSLLDDPDDWGGKNVLVVGGGDSACEAALALADAGARVTISYRGKGFSRAAPKNKQGIEQYAGEGRIKAKLGSQVLQFESDSVTISLADGTQKRYPNDGAFVLIGADPPVQWLEKMGIHFVERPHQHQMAKSDDFVRRFVPRAGECPEDAARAAAQILGGSTGKEPPLLRRRAPAPGRPATANDVSGPRKWLRSATSLFSGRAEAPPPPRAAGKDGKAKSRKLAGPVPLSEFAQRGKSHHTGHGRRDQLSAGERTRILRMLRDEGGRMADEDSQLFTSAPPPPGTYDFDFDDDNDDFAPPPPRADVPAKPALVVGLEQARRQKRASGGGAPPQPSKLPLPLPGSSAKPPTQPPPQRAHNDSRSPPRRPLPKPFEEPTRQVNDAELFAAVRSAPGPGRAAFNDEPTQLGDVDAALLAQSAQGGDARFIGAKTEPSAMDIFPEDESTRLAAAIDTSARDPRRPSDPRKPQVREEPTRAVDIRNDPSISDIDWDID